MYVPLWLAVTIAYALILLALLRSAMRDSGYFAGLVEMGGMCLATIAYLLFWVMYLALR